MGACRGTGENPGGVIVQTLMQNFTASDGLRLSYVIDDHTDPWRPVETKETLFLLHAVLGSSRRFYRWIPELSRHIREIGRAHV